MFAAKALDPFSKQAQMVKSVSQRRCTSRRDSADYTLHAGMDNGTTSTRVTSTTSVAYLPLGRTVDVAPLFPYTTARDMTCLYGREISSQIC